MDNGFVDRVVPIVGVYGLGVYIALLRNTTLATQTTFTSTDTLARMLGISKRQVKAKIKELCQLNVIGKETKKIPLGNGRQHYYPNVYYILDESQWNVPEAPKKPGVQEDISGVQETAYQGCTGCTRSIRYINPKYQSS